MNKVRWVVAGMGLLLAVVASCAPQVQESEPGSWTQRRAPSLRPGSVPAAAGHLLAMQPEPAAPARPQGPQEPRTLARRALVTWAEGLEPQGLADRAVEQRWLLPAGAVVRQLPAVGGMVVDLDAAQWLRLQADPAVAAVTADYAVYSQMLPAELVAAVGPGPTGPSQLKVSGAGVAVAVVDTGIDANHPALQGKVVKQLCFVSGGCGSPAVQDGNGHGTHVASLIASSGKGAPYGIAPGVQLLALRVFGKGGSGKASDVLAALDWLVTNGPAAKVRLVNLSLGSDAVFAGTCDSADPLTAKAIAKLRAKGMAVVAAAGNGASNQGLSAPACLRGAIAVAAVYTADYGDVAFDGLCSDLPAQLGHLTCFSNWSKRLDLTAPGAMLVGAKPGGGTAVMAGTSQASPVVAAVAALVLQCAPKLTPAKLASLLKSTAKPLPAAAGPAGLRLVQALPALAKVCPKELL